MRRRCNKIVRAANMGRGCLCDDEPGHGGSCWSSLLRRTSDAPIDEFAPLCPVMPDGDYVIADGRRVILYRGTDGGRYACVEYGATARWVDASIAARH